MDVRPQPFDLFGAADAAGADGRLHRKRRQTAGLPHDQHVADRSALQDGGEQVAILQHRRQVFQAVHRDVDFSGGQRFFDFLDENAFIEGSLRFCHVGQGNVGAAVAGGFDHLAEDFPVGKCRCQGGFGGGGLHEGQLAAARADDDGSRGFAHLKFRVNSVFRAPTR